MKWFLLLLIFPCLLFSEGGRLLVNVEPGAHLSALELAHETKAQYVQVDLRNPFIPFEDFFLELPFVVLSESLPPHQLRKLSRRYGYRYISIHEGNLESATKYVNEVRKEVPKYSSQLENLPPAEIGAIYQLLEKVDHILSEHHIPFWATRETLLGAVRFHELIPSSDDFSISCFATDEAKLLKLREEFEKAGLGLHYDKKDFYKIYALDGEMIEDEAHPGAYFPFRFPVGDIFLMDLEKTKESRDVYVHKSDDFYKHYPRDRMSYRQLREIKRVPFGPTTIPIPLDSHEILNGMYGMENDPALWQKYLVEPFWDHKREMWKQSGACMVSIDGV